MTNTWGGSAWLRPGRLVIGGAIGATGTHAHHSVQVIAAIGGQLALAGPAGGRFVCRSAVVGPDSPHAVLTGVPRGVVIHCDPESRTGRRLARTIDAAGPESWIRAGERLIPGELPADPVFAARTVEEMLDETVGGDPHSGAVRHPGLARVLRELPARLAGGQVRLGEAANLAVLSESRLAHLFRSQVGLPFRAYVRWLRLQRAMAHVAAGETLTAAAHKAGFADQAHLTRVCRRTFGVAPTEFTRHVRWLD